MKRCPKCNRTYQTDTQKFCTHDGGALFVVDPESETVQFDSSKVRDAVAKPTTRDLAEQKPAGFDPEATVVSAPRDESSTTTVISRNTRDIALSQATRTQEPPPAPPTGASSGAISPHQTSAPLPPPISTTSGPIPPPQTSDPLLATQAAMGPSVTSAPLPPPQARQAQPSQPLAAPRPPKKSKLPLVLGILAVLLVLGIGVVVAAYLVVVRPMLAERELERPAASEPTQTNPSLPTSATPTDVPKPAEEPPPYSPPADAVQFENAKDNLEGKLLENYIDFSFYYPNRWVKVPSTGNFITVERRLPPDFTQENFAAAPWYSSDESTFDDAFFRKLAEKDDVAFAKKFPEYRKVSEGPTKVGVYDAYEFRFEATSRGTDKGDITLWGREIFFPPRQGEKTGLKLLILTTSLAPELKNIDDVGQKGELPMLLESFRFGKK